MKPASPLFAAAILAVACSTACAQPNVAVYGTADMYVGQVRNIGGTAAQGNVVSANSGGLTTSFIGFKGKEELGDGVDAIFSLESFMRMDTGAIGRNDTDPLWGRAANVGISSARFGSLTFGRHVTPYSLAATNYTPLKGTTSISPIFSTIFRGNVQGDTRFNNSVRYVSPDINGWAADVVLSLGRENPPGPDEHREQAVDGSLRYNHGPFRAIVATRIINLNTASDGHEQKSYMGAVIQDLKLVKLNGQYHWSKETYDAPGKDITRKTYEAGAQVPIGRGELSLSWSTSNVERPLKAGVPDKRTAWVVAYDYYLSRRTDIYTGYFRDEQRSPDVLQRQAIAGVRYSFP
jgi:predicted porin